MKKILVIGGLLLAIVVSGFIGQTLNVNATSKVELEELVQKQQITIDNLTSQLTEVNNQLSETSKRLAALESKENGTDGIETRLTKVENIIGQWDSEMSVIQYLNDLDNRFNKRVLLLEKINKVDSISIQKYMTRLPEEISNAISNKIYWDLNNGCGYSSYPNQNNCTYPIEQESLTLDPASTMIGSFNYNIFDYISEEKLKELVINAYNEKKSDKVIYKNIKVYVIEPFDLTYKIIDIPLQ